MLLILEAADFIDYEPDEERPRYIASAEEFRSCVQRAIESAGKTIGDSCGGVAIGAVVTMHGAPAAIVRWNADVEPEPHVDVLRFDEQLTLY